MSASQFLTWMFGNFNEDNDNDPVHTSPPANGFQKDNISERPRQNSESNDVEMLWQNMERAIHAGKLSSEAAEKNLTKCSGHRILHNDFKDSPPNFCERFGPNFSTKGTQANH